jgi:hypothetical protein
VTFASATVADEDHVLSAGDVFATGQLVELRGVHRRLLELEVLQTLAVRETRFLEPALGAPLTAVVELQLEQVGQVVTMRGTLTGGLVGEIAIA